ncbi:hypothetical protein CDAR_105091 [Caerostris darwini]|uniref:Ribosomal protein L2 n=1 Tax=Caerostris darwini TaxID=1538125 RepID=A0AAV4V515_9ARAC|nr:hypothetical protein CDAR_105091 [Caerostris darwini]
MHKEEKAVILHSKKNLTNLKNKSLRGGNFGWQAVQNFSGKGVFHRGHSGHIPLGKKASYIRLVISGGRIRGSERVHPSRYRFSIGPKERVWGIRRGVTNDDCAWGRRVQLMTRSPLITIINNGQALTRPRWDRTPSPDRPSRPDIRPPLSFSCRLNNRSRRRGVVHSSKVKGSLYSLA